jgi:Na+-driven multidrug efflux pump
MKIASIAQPLMAFCDCFAGSLRGAGDTKSPMIAAIFGPVAVRITACYLLAFTFELGLVGIWIGSTFDWGVRALWLFFVVKKGRWKEIEI